MKNYTIECTFDGCMHYEIDAKSDVEAIREAKTLFNDECDENIANRIDRNCAMFKVVSVNRPNNFVDDFLTDEDKMRDFIILSKEEFLASYSYLNEVEYETTIKLLSSILSDISLFGSVIKERAKKCAI